MNQFDELYESIIEEGKPSVGTYEYYLSEYMDAFKKVIKNYTVGKITRGYPRGPKNSDEVWFFPFKSKKAIKDGPNEGKFIEGYAYIPNGEWIPKGSIITPRNMSFKYDYKGELLAELVEDLWKKENN